MTGVTALEKTLIGVEASAGSATDTVTTHWRGNGKIKDRREIVFPPERVGKIGGTLRSYIPKTGGEVLLEGDATFEQLCYIKNAAIYNTTPTTDASSGITRQWTVQAASTDPISTTDLATLVVESGDNQDAEIARYCFVREYTESGNQGEGLQISATLQSRAPTTCTFTAVGDTDLSNPAQTILCSMVRLYIDNVTSATDAGNTQVTETYLSHTFKHTTGWVAVPARDARLDFSNIKRIDDELTLDVTFEHNGFADTEKAAFRNQTERAIRLEFIGNALTTTDAGATFDTYIYRKDMWGKWMTFGAEGLEEQDGDNIYRGTLKIGYSATSGYKMIDTIVNETATLP